MIKVIKYIILIMLAIGCMAASCLPGGGMDQACKTHSIKEML